MDIPMEMLTFAVSSVWSGILTVASERAKVQSRIFEHQMAKADKQESATDSARKFGGWHFTRRALALMTVGSVIVWPAFAPAFFPHMDVTIGWTEMTNGFWPFTDPKESVAWHTVTNGGLVITPLMTHMTSAIMGFFFGNQVAK
jgi:hypothetical protein